MPAPRILPLGFIDRTTDNRAIIRLTAPSDSHNLRPETPATLRRRSAGNGTSGYAGGGGHDDWNQPGGRKSPGGVVRGPGTGGFRGRVARRLRDKGMPVVEIAEVLEVTRASVYRYLSETEGNES